MPPCVAERRLITISTAPPGFAATPAFPITFYAITHYGFPLNPVHRAHPSLPPPSIPCLTCAREYAYEQPTPERNARDRPAQSRPPQERAQRLPARTAGFQPAYGLPCGLWRP